MKIHTKLDLVNEQSDDRIMQDFQLRKANCFSCEPLNPGSEIQIFALILFGVAFAHPIFVTFKMTFISASGRLMAGFHKGVAATIEAGNFLITGHAR